MESYEQSLFNWHSLQLKIQKRKKEPPRYDQGEVWSCNIGLNIGFEEFGKGSEFLRPVLIIKKYNRNIFLGLPLTSTRKSNQYYFNVRVGNREGAILLSQARTLSSMRLKYRIHIFGREEFSAIIDEFVRSIVLPPSLTKGSRG